MAESKDKYPSREQRERALDQCMKDHKEHVIQQGGIPNQREIESTWTKVAEREDRERGR